MTDRKRHLLRLAVSLLAIPAFGTMLFAFADEDGHEVALSDLPAVIQKALSNIEADDIEIEAETRDGKRVYEVEIEADDAEVELTLSEDGRLLGLEIEQEDDGDETDD